jgi:hypothetical protein
MQEEAADEINAGLRAALARQSDVLRRVARALSTLDTVLTSSVHSTVIDAVVLLR